MKKIYINALSFSIQPTFWYTDSHVDHADHVNI